MFSPAGVPVVGVDPVVAVDWVDDVAGVVLVAVFVSVPEFMPYMTTPRMANTARAISAILEPLDRLFSWTGSVCRWVSRLAVVRGSMGSIGDRESLGNVMVLVLLCSGNNPHTPGRFP